MLLETDLGGKELGYPADGVIMVRGRSSMLVDLRTGATRPAGDDDLAWCGHTPTATYPKPWYDDDEPVPESRELYGHGVYQPCSATKDETSRQPPAIPRKIGLEVAGTTVVAMPDRAVGYR